MDEYRMVKIGDIELGEFPLALAPMEDVSDPPFRALCKRYGADLLFTEFISVEGLIRDAEKSLQKLDIYEDERPVGIQIFGADIEHMKMAVRVTEKSNPDFIDINFGCPVKKVTNKGAGAGILKDIPKMVKLSEALVKETNLPITVKTRLGWDTDSIYIEQVAEQLQDVGIQALSIHGRTRSQMYKGEADWTLIGKIKENPRMHIPIFGNGDVTDPKVALKKKNKYGVDGIMIGRASIGNPWIFNEVKHYFATGEILPEPTIQERVAVCLEHFERSLKWKGERLGILEMRRHYGRYFKGISHFKAYRMRLVTSLDPDEIRAVLAEVSSGLAGFDLLI